MLPAAAASAPIAGAVSLARFVLVGASHAGNVGAAARAIKVMGFRELVLVAPRREGLLSHEDAVAMASGAADVLTRTRTVATLAEALQGITHACATAMTPRGFGPPTAAPRAHLAGLAPQVLAGAQRVAFVFGSERHGLANSDVWACHQCLSIPTVPGFGSLNLAQAVQVLAYELREALGSHPVVARGARPAAAGAEAVAGLLAHWQRVLLAIGFLDPRSPKKLMPRLQQLANRTALHEDEVHILRGIADAVERAQAGGRADRG